MASRLNLGELSKRVADILLNADDELNAQTTKPQPQGSLAASWQKIQGKREELEACLKKAQEPPQLDELGVQIAKEKEQMRKLKAEEESRLEQQRMEQELREKYVTMADGYIDKAYLEACKDGDVVAMRALLNSDASDEIERETEVESLHLATKKGHVEIVRFLLEDGVDVHSEDEDGRTPLHHASWNGHFDVVELLLAEGANVKAYDDEGGTAIHYATFGRSTAIVELLAEKGADLEAKDICGDTALHWAAWSGKTAIAEMLLDKGADLNAKNRRAETPLGSSYHKYHMDTILLLRNRGARDDRVEEMLYQLVLQQRELSWDDFCKGTITGA